MDKERRRKWTVAETKEFLAAYARRKDEFVHARKKQFAMANVLEDLQAAGVLSQPTTTTELQTKLKNLLRAFKTAKDAQNTTGAARACIPFEEELEEIFGDRPILTNTDTISVGGTPRVRDLAACALPVPKAQERPPKRLSNAEYLEAKLELKRQAMANKVSMHREKMEKLDAVLNLLKK